MLICMAGQCLTSGWLWMGRTDVNFDLRITSSVEYVLKIEVDLGYTNNLEDSHSDFALYPENMPFGETKECKFLIYMIHIRVS